MDTRVGKRYFLIPLLYLAVIALLLYLQFGREEAFRFKVDGITVSGSFFAGRTGASRVARISLSTAGLTLHFSQGAPVGLRMADGSSEEAGIQSYSLAADGIDLQFSDGVSIRFGAGGSDGRALTIAPVLPAGIPIDSIALAYSIDKGSHAEVADGIPLIAISQSDPVDGANRWYLTLPFQSRIESKPRLLVMAAAGDAGVYAPADKSENPMIHWFGARVPLPDEAAYAQAVTAYRDKLWNGLATTRGDASAGTWQLREGSPAFSESALSALLVEALRRGIYADVLPVMRRAAGMHVEDVTLASAPFLGDPAAHVDRYSQEAAATVRGLEPLQGLAASPTLLGATDLLTLAADHGSAGAAGDLYAMMEAFDPGDADMTTCLVLLNAWLNAAGVGFDPAASLAGAARIVNARILPAIVRTASGLFLETEPGKADVAATAYAGRLLIEYAAMAKRSDLATVGEGIIVSVLALADADGFVTGRLLLKGESVAGGEGFVAPERIYPWVADAPYYPREVSLSQSFGDGAWLWAASAVTNVTKSAGEISLTFDYPAGQTEYILLAGIKPFSGVKMYGGLWGENPNLDDSSAGWSYLPALRLLVVKLLHQQEQTQVEILYPQSGG